MQASIANYVKRALSFRTLKACARFLQSRRHRPTHRRARSIGELTAWIRVALQGHAARDRASDALHPPGGLCCQRPPSLDQGEITDKGSINQRAMLRCRAELVALLYADVPSAVVITLSSG